MTQNNPYLRAALDRLTTPPLDAGNAWIDEQVQAIASLRERCSHTIDVFEQVSYDDDGNGWINCFMYALGIPGSKHSDVLADSTFIRYLIKNNLLVPKHVDPLESDKGDVVIYFNALDKPTHAALRHDDRFLSKWGGCGTLGPIWQHGLYEVPAQYGDQVLAFTHLAEEDVMRAYSCWRQECR